MHLAVEYEYCTFIVSAKSEAATGLVMAVLVAQTVQTSDDRLLTVNAGVHSWCQIGFQDSLLHISCWQVYVLCTMVSKACHHGRMHTIADMRTPGHDSLA